LDEACHGIAESEAGLFRYLDSAVKNSARAGSPSQINRSGGVHVAPIGLEQSASSTLVNEVAEDLPQFDQGVPQQGNGECSG